MIAKHSLLLLLNFYLWLDPQIQYQDKDGKIISDIPLCNFYFMFEFLFCFVDILCYQEIRRD